MLAFILILALTLFPLSSALGGCLLISILFQSKPHYKIAWASLFSPFQKKCLLLFFTYSFVQLLWVEDPLAHGAGLFSHYLLLLGLTLGFYGLLKTEKIFPRHVVTGLWSGAIALSVIGLGNYFLGWQTHIQWLQIPFYDHPYLIDLKLIYPCGHACGFAMNPNILAAYLSATLFLGFELNPKIPAWTKILGSALILSCVVFTFSRAAWVALSIGALFLMVQWLQKKQLKTNFLFLIIAFGFTSSLFYFSNTAQIHLNFLGNATHHANALRIETWQQALLMIWEHPLGIGILNYEKIASIYQVNPLPHIHNWGLQVGVESGWIGSTLFLLFIWGFKSNWKQSTPVLKTCALTFVCFSFFDYPIVDLRVALPCVLWIALLQFRSIPKEAVKIEP